MKQILTVILAILFLSCIACKQDTAGEYADTGMVDVDTGSVIQPSGEDGEASAAIEPAVKQNHEKSGPAAAVRSLDGLQAYYLEDGEVTAYFSEDAYNIFVQDNPAGSVSLSRYHQDKETMDQYMILTRYALWAFPIDATVFGEDFGIRINIKKDKYADIQDLSTLSSADFASVAFALISGFGTETYEVFENDQAKFIVFQCNLTTAELRYATIHGGDMIYVICSCNTQITDVMQTATEAIANNLIFD